MEKISRRKFGFLCHHCKRFVIVNKTIGTDHRNHCPVCLWSLHVDLSKPGDRKSYCHGSMEPIGLVFKNGGTDKYGNKRIGEMMLVHICLYCWILCQNRIAADDNTEKILEVFEKSKNLDEKTKEKLKAENIQLVGDKDEAEVRKQLFGKE